MKKQAEEGSSGTAGTEGKSRLLTGIERDARAEAEQIRAEAEKAAAERRKAAEAQALAIREEARRKAAEAARGIARQGEQAATVEARRTALRAREQISQRTVAEASKKLAGMVGRPEYRAVLKGWIVEAVLGLNVAEAEVLASGLEMAQIDDELLGEAAAEAARLSGAPVTLRRSAAQPLQGQGVVVTSKDGKTAFNNQVATRLARYQSEVRKLIFGALEET